MDWDDFTVYDITKYEQKLLKKREEIRAEMPGRRRCRYNRRQQYVNEQKYLYTMFRSRQIYNDYIRECEERLPQPARDIAKMRRDLIFNLDRTLEEIQITRRRS